MTTDPGQAHSATPPVTPPVGPPVPAPPRHFPPTAQGSGPASRGPQRRFTRWIVGGVVLVAVAAAGVASGWALRGATSTQTPTTPSASRAPSGAGFDIAQAKTQACNGYATAGTQWARDDPKVTAVTADFDTKQTQVAAQLAQLTDPNAPLTSSTRFAMCGSRSLTSPPARRDCDAGRNQRQNRPSQCCNVHRQQGVRPDLDSPDSAARYCQDLWMRLFQATSVSVDWQGSSGVMSTGRSSSFPLWNTAPARTRATRCGAFTARQRVCAASMSL